MKANGGCIINITAQLHWNGSALQVHVAAAKAGVDALTKTLACEWGPQGVRVVGIVPGAIVGTEGFERLLDMNNMNNKEATLKARENKSSSGNEALTKLVPVPLIRFGEVEDIANCALFLGSAAGAYMTGETVVVDGGAYLTAPNSMFF